MESPENNTSWTDRICYRCHCYLKLAKGCGGDAVSTSASASINSNTDSCVVCLGLWSDSFAERLAQQLHSACEHYGGIASNRFANQPLPTIMLPGDIALRYFATIGTVSSSLSRFQIFCKDLKEHIRSIMHHCTIAHHAHHPQNEDNNYKFIDTEQQGHMACHLIVTPTFHQQSYRPPSFPYDKYKRNINTRKRFRGNDPTEKQGGDPLVNLELRLTRAGYELWSMANCTNVLLEHSTEQQLGEWKEWLQQHATTNTTASTTSHPTTTTTTNANNSNNANTNSTAIDLHPCLWRTSFFIRGLYTKSRRDVSQTPFYVPGKDHCGNNVQQRKGVTSVEEQIVTIIAELCGGISKLNNNTLTSSDVVYGMIKFHASGREDLDVRMTLPPEPTEGVGGRPFCLEVIDAFQMPPLQALKEAVLKINHGSNSNIHQDKHMRYYGTNPLGVGVSDCLCFTPSHTFRNLQAETEEKVKFYGCLCWSSNKIISETHLRESLSKIPITIQQRTPIRVLHRRSNIVRTRHVLTLKATLIDEHYFRLNISTDAGTYVKEFVHGDLGRTIPSVSSLLGCKTDILELDCEGIKF